MRNNDEAYLESVSQFYVSDCENWRALEAYDADGERFFVSNTMYLRLVFFGQDGIPFTSFRKLNEENCAKYFPYIGCWFDIIVDDEEEG